MQSRTRPCLSFRPLRSARTLNATTDPSPTDRRQAVLRLTEWWDSRRARLAALLSSDPPSAALPDGVRELALELQTGMAADPDLAVYWQIQHTAVSTRLYCASHSLACAVICAMAAEHLGLSAPERQSLLHAALSMNCAMANLQDRLSVQVEPLDETQREAIARHGLEGRLALAAAGVDDPWWLELVAQHHERDTGFEGRLADAAELLRRTDVFAAKLSVRRTRMPTTPVLAARDACLDASGVPGRVGAAMLRVLGLYPNGTWVQLADGDFGVVIRQGSRVTTPQVAALRRADGATHHQPLLRNTALASFAVVRCLPPHEAKMRIDHVRVLTA